MVETTERLLGLLDNEELRRIARMRLEGYQNGEIAEQIGRSLPTVERRLKVIREIWKAEGPNG